MAELDTSKNRKKNGLTRRPGKSTKVDLTPMVDLGFLLITFFVFTTSISEPTAMNFFEPRAGAAMPVKESGVMTIIIGKERQLFYYLGMPAGNSATAQITKIDFKQARDLIAKKKKETILDDLMFIIKASDDASFGDGIELLDEMSVCNVPPGHYAEADITEHEAGLVATKENR